MRDISLTEQTALMASLSAEGLGCEAALSRAYCELTGSPNVSGQLMSAKLIDTAADFSSWLELAERDGAAFPMSFVRDLAERAPQAERRRELEQFVLLLRAMRGDESELPNQLSEDELARLAGRELGSVPMPQPVEITADDRRAHALLERRSGRHVRSLWEAMALYIAALRSGMAPIPTLGQYASAVCGRQAAHRAAASGLFTAGQERARLRAAAMVSAALLASPGCAALNLLFSGSIAAAASACRRAVDEAAALTARFNREAAAMLEALHVRIKPLVLSLKRREAAAEPAPVERTALESAAEAETEPERNRQRGD